MKTECRSVLFLCNLIAWSVAKDNFLNDDYVDGDENLRNVDLDRLRLLRNYVYANGENRRSANDELDDWNGRWMPDRSNEPIPPLKIYAKQSESGGHGPSESLHGVLMGVPSSTCDDAKTNLTIDWNSSPVDHTCYDKKIVPDRETIPVKYCERIPKNYVATHICMHERIEYDVEIPLFGSHRPLWPVYGEYKFLPKQRWLHSLEHGAIVALYHPCANPLEVKRLKSLVAGCLRRHVISPYNLLRKDRPLALVSWGCRLTMSYVNSRVVTTFIREHALQGPEGVAKDGHFNDGLLYPAETVSDHSDSRLCPNVRV